MVHERPLNYNPYASLELMPSASPAEIKRRYRELAKRYHPDRSGNADGSEEKRRELEGKLRDLNEAYAFLSHPAHKAEFDASYASIFSPARAPQPEPSVLPSALYGSSSYGRSARGLPRRRGARRPLRVAIGLTLLMLLSTGAGLLFTAVSGSSPMSGLFGQASSKPAGPDSPPPVYSFVPTRSAFDSQDTSGQSAGSQTDGGQDAASASAVLSQAPPP